MSHFLEKVYIFSIQHIVPITKKGGQASILKVKGGVFASCCYKIIGITLMLLRPIFANQSFLSSHLNDFKNWIHPFSYYAIYYANWMKPVVKELSYLVQFSRFRQLQIPEISRFCLFDLGFSSKGFYDSFLPGLDCSLICQKNHYFQPNFAL